MEVAGKRLDDDIVSELCEPCQEGNVSTQADGYCNDCEEYMCQACFQNHVKMKVLRNHVLGAVDAGRKQGKQSHAEKCKKHKTETIKYYCRNHDNVGCGDCIVSYHGKCEPEFIRNLANNFEESSDFKNIVKEVENLDKLKAEIEVSLEKYKKYNAEFHDKAIEEIQKYRAEINTWLENVTSKVEAEETKIWKENEMILSKLEDWVKIISDMINKVRDDISIEKYKGENLFIRVIECKSEIIEFSTKSVPEIKSSLEIQSFTFEPSQSLLELTKSKNLGAIKVGGRNEDLQTSIQERQNDIIDGASKVASSNLPTGRPEAENVGAGDRGTVKRSEDTVRAELEKELEQIRQTTIVEKEKHEGLQQSYNTLKKTFEDQVSLLSREREQSILVTKDREQMIIRLQQDINSLKSQLDSRIKENETLVSTSKARQEQDQNTIISLQSKLKKLSENHKEERDTLSRQIRDLQRQRAYQLPDPRAAGFDIGKRVESTNLYLMVYVEYHYNHNILGWTGTVTAVNPSGYVNVKWDHGLSGRFKAGAGGVYMVNLL